uniref:E2 NEDD8-conjugating enzyme n=1 Tax=Strigamia maritima TaxID=126957 RepID=T1JGH3_STRMM
MMFINSKKPRKFSEEVEKSSGTSPFRSKLLKNETDELQLNLPSTCSIKFDNPDQLSNFDLIICPDEGHWQKGRFRFSINVPYDYNMAPPIVKCHTRIWHPNIGENGDVCLGSLRVNRRLDFGWFPSLRLMHVVWDVNSLFTHFSSFDDSLNGEAAGQYWRDRDGFSAKVKNYVELYAKMRPIKKAKRVDSVMRAIELNKLCRDE